MADLTPGYVSTLCNPTFSAIKGNIVVVGKEDGKVYSIFQTKEDFFDKIAQRKRKINMVCCYRNLEFSENELEYAWANRVFPISEKEKNNIVSTWLSSSMY
jgi:hypothetical protein